MIPLKSLAIAALCLTATSNADCADAAALAKLQGKWSTKKTTDSGREVTQVLEIKGNKLTFQVLGADDQVRLFAQGTAQAEALGPFRVLKISDIRAGRSADETEAVNDDRMSVYVLGEGTLTLASNFDKERENQKPMADTYRLVEAPKETAAAAGDAAAKLAGKWKLTLKMGDDDRDYDLVLTHTEGKLAGVLISPRSGEHKFKSVTLADGKLTMELVRDIQGTEATFLYTGKLAGDELSGDVVVKGFEEQFKGTWKARK